MLVIAAGVQPDSVAVLQILRGGGLVHQFQTRWANDNCVINQEYVLIDPAVSGTGDYSSIRHHHRRRRTRIGAPAARRWTSVPPG